jgi:ankyrin repeat protein
MQAYGQTALHMAAQNGHTDIVNALLAAGTNLSATTTVRYVCVAARNASDVSGL